MPKKIFFFIRILVTILIFIVLFRFIPYSRLIQVYRDAHKIYLVYAFLIFWLGLFLAIFRWRCLLSAIEIKPLPQEIIYSYLSGLFLNLFFPSVIAGDLFRCFAISARHRKTNQVFSTVFIDRFAGGLALVLVALVGLLLLDKSLLGFEVFFSILILCLIVVFLSFSIFSRPFSNFFLKIFKKKSRFYNKVLSFQNQLIFFAKKPVIFYKILLISLFIQVLTPAGFFVAGLAFGLDLSPIIFLAIIPIVMAFSFIPVTIAGAGTREALTVYFLSAYGVAEPIALGIALLNFVYLVLSSLVGGLFYVVLYHRWLQPSS